MVPSIFKTMHHCEAWHYEYECEEIELNRCFAREQASIILERGCRQEGMISTQYLFVLSAEILSTVIRNFENVWRLRNKEVEISQKV